MARKLKRKPYITADNGGGFVLHAVCWNAEEEAYEAIAWRFDLGDFRMASEEGIAPDEEGSGSGSGRRPKAAVVAEWTMRAARGRGWPEWAVEGLREAIMGHSLTHTAVRRLCGQRRVNKVVLEPRKGGWGGARKSLPPDPELYALCVEKAAELRSLQPFEALTGVSLKRFAKDVEERQRMVYNHGHGEVEH